MNTPYIKSITLSGFCNSGDLVWQLNRGVNILSGANGSGKSTLIAALSHIFAQDNLINSTYKPYKTINVEFEDGTTLYTDGKKLIKSINNVVFINSIDSPLHSSEAISKITGNSINSDLDWQLYTALKLYLSFELVINKRAVEMVRRGEISEGLQQITATKEHFFNLLDSLFIDSSKNVIRDSDQLLFKLSNKIISPYSLSAGEKQLLLILIHALTQDKQPTIMIMDEPEVSLHHGWQRKLLSSVMSLNPNLQLIVTTHSPAIIMDGWIDRITDISDITSNIASDEAQEQ